MEWFVVTWSTLGGLRVATNADGPINPRIMSTTVGLATLASLLPPFSKPSR